VSRPTLTVIAGANGAGKSSLTAGNPGTFAAFPLETTLSGNNYLKMMNYARGLENGFDVFLIYIGTESVEINLTRIAKRVQVGGHDVPEADVRRRYVRSFRNLPMAFRIADSTLLFDNSEDVGFRPVGICHNAEQRWFDPLPVWAAELSVAASKRANR
jgi:predicted ABC-type ATPase